MQKHFRIWQWMFLLLVATLPFQTILQFRVANTSVQFSDLIVPVAGLAWLLDRRRDGAWSIFYSFLAIFIVAMALSALFSVDPGTSGVKLSGKILLAAIAFLAFNFVRSAGFEPLVRAWTAAALIVLIACVIGIAAFYAGFRNPQTNLVLHPIFGSLPAGNYPRIEGFSLFPAILCNYLSVSWWLAMIGGATLWVRAGILSMFRPLLILANIFTFTPGLGGFLLSNGIFIGRKFPSPVPRYLAISMGVLAATGVLLASMLTLFALTPNGVHIPILNGEFIASHRVDAWSSALETFSRHPIFGVGIGMPTSSAVYMDPNGNRQLLADAHNTYINVLAESGVLGFLAFFAIVFWSGWQLIRTAGLDSKKNLTRLCLGLALIDAFFFQGLTGSYEDQRHIWVLLGLVAAFDHMKSEPATEDLPQPVGTS
jgi:O-antigen ligase